MSFSHNSYLALRQSLDDEKRDPYIAPEGNLESRTANKPRKFRTTAILLGTTTVILLAVVAIQAIFLVRSSQPSLSIGKPTLYQERLLS